MVAPEELVGLCVARVSVYVAYFINVSVHLTFAGRGLGPHTSGECTANSARSKTGKSRSFTAIVRPNGRSNMWTATWTPRAAWTSQDTVGGSTHNGRVFVDVNGSLHSIAASSRSKTGKPRTYSHASITGVVTTRLMLLHLYLLTEPAKGLR